MQKHLNEVLSSCTHYDFIVNHIVANDDFLSENLIQFYKDYVFFNWSSNDDIKLLDNIIYLYITEFNFSEYLHNHLDLENILPVFEVLVDIYNNYEKEKIKIVDNTIWI